MANLIALWSGLSLARKLALVGILAGTIAAFAVLVNAAAKPQMTFLYGGLNPSAAGDVVAALEAMDVRTDVRGDAIYVPKFRRDSIRMELARQGLPRQGQPGFELLDEMNGFAMTSDMFDAAYWRAKEGELARTILTTPGVRGARVHLSVPKSSSFSRHRRAATASATITMQRGRLDPAQASAIRYLIALAVPNLENDQVAIIDSVYGVVLKPGEDKPQLDDLSVDDIDRTRRLEEKLVDLLEARVGINNARVSVSLKIDRQRETVTENLLDPDSRVMMARETTEVQESGVGGGSAVTVASNLPDGDVVAGGEPRSSNRAETNETTRFDISKIQRQREKLPGAISQLNVAVLVNEPSVEEGANGEATRSVEELEALRELVTAAIGFSEERGDVVTVKSMQFFKETTAIDDQVEPGGFLQFLRNNIILVLQIIAPAIVVIILALFVLRPVLLQDALVPPIDPTPLAVPATALLDQSSQEPKAPIEELRDLAKGDPKAATTILKSWLGETESQAAS